MSARRRSNVTGMRDALAGFRTSSFTADGVTRPVHEIGAGPAVVVIAEIPGITPEVAGFARRVADAGMTAVLPELFGEPGRPLSGAYAGGVFFRACIAREFATLALNRTSPVTSWLRALARDAHSRCGGRRERRRPATREGARRERRVRARAPLHRRRRGAGGAVRDVAPRARRRVRRRRDRLVAREPVRHPATGALGADERPRRRARSPHARRARPGLGVPARAPHAGAPHVVRRASHCILPLWSSRRTAVA